MTTKARHSEASASMAVTPWRFNTRRLTMVFSMSMQYSLAEFALKPYLIDRFQCALHAFNIQKAKLNRAKGNQFSASQWFWALEAYLRLWLVKARLQLRKPASLGTILCLTESPAELTDAGEPDPVATAMHESVRLAARCHIGKTDCLPRSIVLADMLRRRSQNAHIMLGVAKHGDNISSHAWVELDGKMIAEPESVRSVPGKPWRL